MAEPEPLIEARAADLPALARLAWHLGDRHVPIQVLERRLRLKRDPAIEALLQSLGAKVVAIDAPFEPEGGAYAAPAGDHHHHHHDHEHDHDHDHGHDHHHDHEPRRSPPRPRPHARSQARLRRNGAAQGQDRSDHRRGRRGRPGRGGGGRAPQAGIAITSDLAGRHGADHALDVTSEPDWLRVIAEIGRDARPARRPGQRGGHRGAGQHRGDRFRHLAADPGGQSRRHVSRLQARPCAAQAARRRDRQRLVGRGPDRRAQLRRLQRLQGRRAAAHQIGGAARRAARSAGALQFDPSGLSRRADGRRDAAADQFPDAARARITARHSARPARHAGRGRRHVRLSAVGRIRASSPAPNSSSTAG